MDGMNPYVRYFDALVRSAREAEEARQAALMRGIVLPSRGQPLDFKTFAIEEVRAANDAAFLASLGIAWP